jgi:hypothetical protein
VRLTGATEQYVTKLRILLVQLRIALLLLSQGMSKKVPPGYAETVRRAELTFAHHVGLF